MRAPLVPDDGLRNHRPGILGTNKRYPCGHPRTAENTRVSPTRLDCKLCRRRIEREAYHRRKAAAAFSIQNTKAPA